MPNILFKEFLPDQPELGNPGLINARNVLPLDAGYGPFLPLDTTLGTITQTAIVGAFAANGSTKGSHYVYALANLNYYEGSGGGASFATRGAASASANFEENFAQFGNLVVAVQQSHEPRRHTIGSTSNFTALATNGVAPLSACVGVIGDFVILGNQVGTAGTTDYSHYVSWCAAGDAGHWPVPNSATAIATQSGEEAMPLELGGVQAIHGGDQYGVVLQHKGVSRMTYQGPPTVFGFDVIDYTQGCHFPKGSVQVGRITYFISARGFCRTDGVTVENIGAGKVDRFFWDRVISGDKTQAGYCPVNGLVYFAFPTSASNVCDTIMIHNPRTGQWSYSVQDVQALVTPAPGYGQTPRKIMGFTTAGSSVRLGIFAATAGTAILETGDMELVEGGRGYCDSFKPNVESSGTAPTVTVRVGSRDSLSSASSYSATATPYTRTGVANVRTDAKYMRVETQIVGNFRKAIGVEIDPDEAGYA